jgi:hypothetical protein
MLNYPCIPGMNVRNDLEWSWCVIFFQFRTKISRNPKTLKGFDQERMKVSSNITTQFGVPCMEGAISLIYHYVSEPQFKD